VLNSCEKAPRAMEREGARERVLAPLPIDDPEVRKKIRAVAGDVAPQLFLVRTGLAVSQVKVMSVDQIRKWVERCARALEEGELK